jgi:23S rRNA (guanosine2251-2'-O)-methyltransferase
MNSDHRPDHKRKDKPGKRLPPGQSRPGYHVDKSGKEWRAQEKKGPMLQATLWGVHAVQEAWLNPERRIKALYITELMVKDFEHLQQKARDLGLRRPEASIIDKKDMDRRLPPGAVHQGIALDADPLPETFVQDLVVASAASEKSVILMLDQVTDPHNVGAILRSASAFGATGVIMQRRHSPEMTGVLAKAACGAIEHLPVCYEINLSRALEVLQAAGFQAIAMDEHAENSFATLPAFAKIVIVLGAEGAGLRPKVREHCNHLVRLPTQGPIQSLNVSNAAAIALYAVSSHL